MNKYEYKGKIYTVKELANIANCTPVTIRSRIKKNNGIVDKYVLDTAYYRQTTRSIIGKKFGKLTVVEALHEYDKHRNRKYLCKCECGGKKITIRAMLRRGDVKSCGCLFKKNNLIIFDELKGDWWLREENRDIAILKRKFSQLYTRHCKIGGNKSNLMSFKKFMALSLSNCEYCGCPPHRPAYDRYRDHILMINGLDRRDSRLPYTDNNVLACCFRCNTAKNDMSISDFQAHISKIYHHSIKNKLLTK